MGIILAYSVDLDIFGIVYVYKLLVDIRAVRAWMTERWIDLARFVSNLRKGKGFDGTRFSGDRAVTYFTEKSAPMSTREIDVDVMVFATYRLFYERFAHNLSINDDRVPILGKGYFRGNLEASEVETDTFLHELS